MAVTSAAMGLVFGNAICNQFLRNRIPGFFQIPCDFFLLGLLRGIVCACNDRKWASSRWWLAFFLVCYGLSPLLTWDGPHCLLLGLATMLTTLGLWARDLRLTRLLFLLNSPPLFAYNVFARSYACAAIEVVAFCSFLLAVWRFDIRRSKAEDSVQSVDGA